MEPTTNTDKFNADELEAPDWLSAQFFAEVLSRHEKAPDLKVIEVKMSPASAKGDHYASVMFRGNITYTTSKGKFSKSLIVKTMPEEDGHKKEMLGDSKIFETEIGMYTKVLPKFEEILREAGDETRLYVPCLYHSLKPRQVMIFEDLVPQGYSVIRDREATKEEMQVALKKLAKWQAVSFHLINEKPDYLEEFKHGLFDIPNFADDPFVTCGMSSFMSMLDKIPELSKYKPQFKKLENDYLDRLRDVMQEYRENRQPDGYYVLSHGDFHLRNMMFKHSPTNGAFEDCMLLDFQISNICPITVDLIYAIYMLMGPEDRKNNYKELIDYYFTSFVDTVKKIGFKGKLPSLAELWNQISKHKSYDIFLLTTFLPMMCALESNVFDPTEALTNAETRQKLYFLDNFVEEVKYLLPRFEEQGYLE
ncbi:uncharacterized protein LOC117792307 isoform X2 [Drosophila innubila]|uniref:uncharacterized protein LOC117792307 isoform X2 n=1 Tax=Drosophila innubila TaxID=198719 RepID=UPI00148CDB65|nr:uncharacterized protein LOC117792307 isoform X2 [Drosophila innubila]